MARVTVEDCLAHVKNRFELVLLASKRARQLMRGSVEPTVPWENDKASVVALREIANGHTDFSDAHHVDILAKAPEPIATLETIETIEISETLDITEKTEPEAEEPEAQIASDETEEPPETPTDDSAPETSTTGNSSETQ